MDWGIHKSKTSSEKQEEKIRAGADPLHQRDISLYFGASRTWGDVSIRVKYGQGPESGNAPRSKLSGHTGGLGGGVETINPELPFLRNFRKRPSDVLQGDERGPCVLRQVFIIFLFFISTSTGESILRTDDCFSSDTAF
jgi:hypothetical protein